MSLPNVEFLIEGNVCYQGCRPPSNTPMSTPREDNGYEPIPATMQRLDKSKQFKPKGRTEKRMSDGDGPCIPSPIGQLKGKLRKQRNIENGGTTVPGKADVTSRDQSVFYCSRCLRKSKTHSKEERLRKILKWRKGTDPNKTAHTENCVLCNVGNVTLKPTHADLEKLCLEIYNHAFYEKYSRKKKTQSQDNEVGEVIQICKKASISLRSTPTPPPIQSPASAGVTPVSTPDTEYSSSRQEMLIEKYVPSKPTDVNAQPHVNCGQPKIQTFLFTSDNGAVVHCSYKTLKGWYLRKEDREKRDVQEPHKSIYSVGALGLTFSIPEYNPVLKGRQTCGDGSNLASPRSPGQVSPRATRPSTKDTGSSRTYLPPITMKAVPVVQFSL